MMLLNKSSQTHEAFFALYNNEIIGSIDKTQSNLFEYFHLREVNQQLAEENSRLRLELASNKIAPDSTIKSVADSSIRDTSNRYRKYTYLPARVVGNTITLQNNFITLERGSLQGVQVGMSVISPQGVVGVVLFVSNNYSIVMSVLNRNSRISAMLKKDKNAGSVEWTGENPSVLTLKNITKGAKVYIGDTVLTSSYSANFPSQIMIGTVLEKNADPASNFYTLKVKASTNFSSLQYVYVVKNTYFEEQKAIEQKEQKVNE